MIKNQLILFIITIGITFSTILFGCNDSNTSNNEMNEVGELVKEGVDNTGDAITEIGDSGTELIDKLSDKSMNYNEDDFKENLENKGYKLKEVDDSKSLFSVSNDDYIINNGKISIYQYDEKDSITLENDLKSITNNGAIINGNKMNWNKAAHIYKKGRIVVVYDGDNENIITCLKELLGTALIG